jgi:isoleucyl-tRNA synthetase
MDQLKQGGEEQERAPYVAKSAIAAREEEILAFWHEREIFKKSLEKPSPRGEYIFYDGPPFATGLPHHGHLLQSAIKDAVPRYRTMRGYHVPRRWGWDCHGLPLENQIEQELGIKTKREIEQLGIEKFNNAARSAVLRYSGEWESIIDRFGRWVDMKGGYRTMDAPYTESVWWAFKNLYDRGLAYEGFKAMHLCPRCGTTLSNFEVAQGYKDIDDFAVTVKLRLVDELDTSLLIWTTTPWTLPGNAAAAVKADAMYVKVKVGNEYVIASAEYFSKKSSGLLSAPQPGAAGQTFSQNTQPLQKFLGKELVGKKYEPPFGYFKDQLHKHKTHAFKVYAAPYVTLTDGTGIVHLAPAYGAEDLELAQKEKIPLIHHVTDEGKFVATVTDFAGFPVKPKGRHLETDAKIIENLKARRLLFAEEKIKHSYPHCWRCDTPLLNWASHSWFVNVQKIKNKLVAQNAKVAWVPAHVGTGRFNNGLQTAPDWAISRSRYWGAPLPVWRHSKTKEIKVVGSVDELLSLVRRSGNTYFVMRHGEAKNNVTEILDSYGDPGNNLTERGRKDVAMAAEELKNKKIDLIITSPLLRTKETAAIMQKILALPDSAVMVDERIREVELGVYSGRSQKEWRAFFGSVAERFAHAPEGGETFMSVRRRMGDFLFDIERRYVGKNILIISHGNPIWILFKVVARVPSASLKKEVLPDKATVQELPFIPYPHNSDYELDLHRPYIDDVPMGNSLHGEWKRVPDVFDCWFESGSMPYASNNYPAEQSLFNPKRFFGLRPKGYPADFIAEGLDQTRGWFYSLIVLGTALFGKTPYRAVITNGLILAEDGRKMSKKLKNYPDPMELVERFGADALRYYLLSSPVIRGEDLRFKTQGVEEVTKKLIMRLDNVKSFYELYATADGAHLQSGWAPSATTHALDRWVLSRLGELVQESTNGFETYELDNATRPLAEFIDDLSTWYLRRSRDRFKEEGEDKKQALATLRFALYTTAHVMAPVMPFFAEYLYQAVKGENDAESVHLSSWPEALRVDEQLIADMRQTRALASAALQMREKAGIKLRQPLALLTAKLLPAHSALREVLKDELNVKAVSEDAMLEQEVWLDTKLTPELKEEGMVRNVMRAIQEKRKEQKLNIGDRPDFTIALGKEEAAVAHKYLTQIISDTGLASLTIEIAQE